jgi:predicted permease
MSVLSRFARAFDSRKLDRELSEELHFHFEEAADALVRGGMPRRQAEREARRRLGRQLHHRESSHDAKVFPRLESLFQDVRFGFRMLRRTPAVTAAAILALSLAIGACTAAFSLLDALLLRPLPVAEPRQLVALSYANVMGRPSDDDSFSYPLYQRFRQTASPMADLFGATFNSGFQTATIGLAHEEERVRANWISGEAFGILGLPPVLGRMITPDDERLARPVAVLGHAFWRRRFGASPAALGQPIALGGKQYQIVGVSPSNFSGLAPGILTDIWLPLTTRSSARVYTDPQSDFFAVWGRLKPGVEPERLRQTMQSVFTHFRREQIANLLHAGLPPNRAEAFVNARINATPAATGRATLVRLQFARPLWIIAIVGGLILLLACSNLANLFIARASARERELAMRAAIGAGRARLAQQMLVESALVAIAACSLGVLFAQTAAPALVSRLMPVNYPAYLDLPLNLRVLAFAAATGLAVTLLFGSIPALRASSASPDRVLRSASSHRSARSGVLRPLIAAQAAFSLAVLFLSGMLLLSFRNLTHVDLGFSPHNLAVLTLTSGRVQDPAASELQLLDAVRAVRGVESAAMSDTALVGGAFSFTRRPFLRFAGRERVQQAAVYEQVSPGFFQAMQIPLLQGRDFSPADIAAHSPAVLVNQTFARLYFPERRAAGQRFERAIDDFRFGPQQIIGVVRDAKYNNLREPAQPMVYEPLRSLSGGQLAVRAASSPLSIAAAARDEIQRVNGAVHVSSIELQSTLINDSILPERLLAMLAAFFAVVAASLAAIGLYGVLSYSVVRQTKEIGIRLALGAQPATVVRAILSNAAVTLSIGLGSGLAAGIALARYLESVLFEIKPSDSASLIPPVVAFLAVSALAGLAPSLRATRVDPAETLRHE